MKKNLNQIIKGASGVVVSIALLSAIVFLGGGPGGEQKQGKNELPPEVQDYNKWRAADNQLDIEIEKKAKEKCNSIKTGSYKSFELVGKGYMEIDKNKLGVWADQAVRSCDNSTATLDFM